MKAYEIAPLRKKHRISQASLADKLGLHQGELGKIENGMIPTTDEYVEGILAKLNEMIHAKEEEDQCQPVAGAA
jgi:transcriptional regulator with XRE-family HTH domain